MNDEHAEQRIRLVEILRAQSESCAASARVEDVQKYDFAARFLQRTAEAIDESVGYLESSLLAEAIERFRDSPEERRKASADLNAYLRETGLEISDRARFELHDDNWCVQAVVSYIDEGHTHTVGVHYDSHSGWGAGVCP